MQKVLVAGSNGFIGKYLVRELVKTKSIDRIYAVDLPNSKIMNLHKKVINLEIDLTDVTLFSKLPNDVDTVFMLAALNGTSRFYAKPFEVLKYSLYPTLNLLNFYRDSVTFVYTSSSEVYAGGMEIYNLPVPTPEGVPMVIPEGSNPRWSYATAKIAGEIAVHASAHQFNTKGVILRYHNVYGSHMGLDHFVPDFIQRCRSGIYQIIGADETRSFLHISDAVTGTIQSVKKASSPVPIFHLGTRQELTIRQAAEIILEKMSHKPSSLVELPSRLGSVVRRCPDTTKAKNELGWEALTKFEDGIDKILNDELQEWNASVED